MTSEPNNEREQNRDRDSFIYPHSRYGGHFTPQELIFDANLQEFSQRVSYICGLESNGKMTPGMAYEEIRKLVHQLKQSQQELLDNPDQSDV
jgi:transposase InsO family protein